MDYKGWVLSIYGEYLNKYNEKYKKVSNNEGFNGIIKKIFNKKCIVFNISIIIYIMFSITYSILQYEYKNTNVEKILLNIFIIFSIIEYYILAAHSYKNESSLEDYNNRIYILKVILYEQNIYNEGAIKKLIDCTGGILYKINKKGTISGIFVTLNAVLAGIFNYSKYANKNVLISIIIIIILIVYFSAIAYVFNLAIPNNKIIRRQEFHELLKILIVRDFGNKSKA